MMPYYLTLFAIVAIGKSSSALHSCISHCSSSRRSITPRSSIILSIGRERRVANTSNTSSQQQQLIDKEEVARIKRTGQAKLRLEKSVRRENRISILEGSLDTLSSSEKSELDGLLKVRDNFEEQYNTASFTPEHIEFKRLHNEAFVALARYCHRDRQERGYIDATTEKLNVFYLDGPDCGSTKLLIYNGFDPSQCYVANRHESTCKILQEILPRENVICATASEALSPSDNEDFEDIDFCAYYFDGCGGYTPHIIQMMSSALIRLDDDNQQPRTTAVGFSLMGGNKDIIEKELVLCRALSVIANTRGMRTQHILDDPMRYDIPNEICKTEGGTFTSWILLEAESR